MLTVSVRSKASNRITNNVSQALDETCLFARLAAVPRRSKGFRPQEEQLHLGFSAL